MRRFISFIAIALLFVVAGPVSPAKADWVASRCGTKWQADATEGMNWCVFVGYNDVTGTIEGGFSYSDYQTGNVYAVWVRDVLLWRDDDGSIHQKDSCTDCPEWRFVYNDANEVTTGWSGFSCGKAYWTEADFKIQWEPDGAITDLFVKNSPRIQLC